MRRVDVPLRACAACGATMLRRRWSDGRLESPTLYAKRKTCNHRCKGDARMRTEHRTRHYRQCGDVLRRKRFGRGTAGHGWNYEPWKRFLTREFCDAECHALWLEDPEHRAEHGRRCLEGRRAADRRRRQPLRTRRARRDKNLVCFHGQRIGYACSYCERLRAGRHGKKPDYRSPEEWAKVSVTAVKA